MSDEYRSCDSPQAVLSALADDDCRAILVAAADEPRTVSELVDICEVPMATAYRKVDRLAELDLLDERIRVEPRGRNSREYRLQADSVRIAIPGQQAPAVMLDCTIAEEDPAKNRFAPISTDGGRSIGDANGDDQQCRLRRIFENVTGTIGFVETQEQLTHSWYFDDDRDAAVSEYVTAAAKADGLSDAITVPDFDGEFD